MHGTIKPAIESVDGICKTEAMTFPRSGHHLLKDILQCYFGKALHYCSLYEDSEDMQMGVNPLTNFQKNHDFDLVTAITDDRRYLVQIRDPVDAIESWWHLEQRIGTGGAPVPDYEIWKRGSMNRLGYWMKFVDKWVYSFIPNRLVVNYSDLLNRPESVVTSVIQHLRAKPEVDNKKVKEALGQFMPKPQLQARPAFYERA